MIAGLYASQDDPVEAALYGTVSASFVVEQKGLPLRTSDATLGNTNHAGQGGNVEETEWNRDLPSRRLAELNQRSGL